MPFRINTLKGWASKACVPKDWAARMGTLPAAAECVTAGTALRNPPFRMPPFLTNVGSRSLGPSRLPSGACYSRSAPKVSQDSSRPLSRPVRNQRTRWAELPWVKLSGLTVPRA